MKHSLIVLAVLLLISNRIAAQRQPAFDTTSYTLPRPTGWDKEIFPIPIEFAPSIPYQGQEELRFAPGWGDSTSTEYWSYAFVWFLHDGPAITQQDLQADLYAYYTGLIGRNIEKRKIPKEKLFPVTVQIKAVPPSQSGTRAYAGEVHMLDYMAQRPIILHLNIMVRSCTGNHTAVLCRVSPAPAKALVVQELEWITRGFRCAP